MNCKEWWMATCVMALAVGVGQAQEKQSKFSPPKPSPQVLYIPPVPAVPELTLQLVGLEAVGCKTAAQAVQAAEVKGKSCTSCGGCAAANPADCCGECVKSKREVFASGSTEGTAHKVKKVKKIKKPAAQEYFIVAPPPPPMTAQFGGYGYAPSPAPQPAVQQVVELSTPEQPMMVFRAVSKINSVKCDSGCDTPIQQTKHETHGSIAIGLGLSLTGCSIPTVDVKTFGQLEMECGGCTAKCDKMTLDMPGGHEWTVTAVGKQVVVTGPSFKASCDSFARTTSENSFPGFILQGHVHLHHGKNGMKVDVESEQVSLVLRDGKVEVRTVTAP